MTLEEAKSEAQAMELEIAALIPADVVANVVQKPEGTLFSCDDAQHRWKGLTTVALVPGTEVEMVVKGVEAQMADDDRFEMRSWVDPAGEYTVQLTSPETAANFIFGEGIEEGTIDIDSGSKCFTLPEGVYPGGTF
ncbi:hypothetical protein [Microbacterium sp.]|uniref:hypothetical protein n=1 Tax=Microbacterium sp. TaxID=51671 RepID=UPI002634BB4A|nr:hypothetical protein [Microbacterium sp.]